MRSSHFSQDNNSQQSANSVPRESNEKSVKESINSNSQQSANSVPRESNEKSVKDYFALTFVI